MRRTDSSWTELDELLEPFLPTEATDAAAATQEIRDRLVKVEQQVLSQYTAMAAYAQIAKQDVATARAEGRNDIDRSQATVIGLLEKLRNEMNVRFAGADRQLSGPTPVAGSDKIAQLESTLAGMDRALKECQQQNEVLRAQVAQLVERQMQADGWLVTTGTSQSLSLL